MIECPPGHLESGTGLVVQLRLQTGEKYPGSAATTGGDRFRHTSNNKGKLPMTFSCASRYLFLALLGGGTLVLADIDHSEFPDRLKASSDP